MAKEKGKGKVSKSREIPVFMNIKTDFGFKKIFGNKVLLIAFLVAEIQKDGRRTGNRNGQMELFLKEHGKVTRTSGEIK
jgi:hypothetical protein